MAQDQEKIFADGFIFKRNPKAPTFVVGRVSMKVEEAIAFLKTHEKNGWVNVDIKEARSGNHYMELDTFESKNDIAVDKYNASKQSTPSAAPQSVPRMNGDMANEFNEAQQSYDEEDSDLPF